MDSTVHHAHVSAVPNATTLLDAHNTAVLACFALLSISNSQQMFNVSPHVFRPTHVPVARKALSSCFPLKSLQSCSCCPATFPWYVHYAGRGNTVYCTAVRARPYSHVDACVCFPQVEGADSTASRERERRRRSRNSKDSGGSGGRATFRTAHQPLYPGSSADARGLRDMLARPASGVTVLCVDPPARYALRYNTLTFLDFVGRKQRSDRHSSNIVYEVREC